MSILPKTQAQRMEKSRLMSHQRTRLQDNVTIITIKKIPTADCVYLVLTAFIQVTYCKANTC